MDVESYVDEEFWRCYKRLPIELRRSIRQDYLRWRERPSAARFEGKTLTGKRHSYYRVRLENGCRAVAILHGNVYLWIWVGSHADYDRMLKRLA